MKTMTLRILLLSFFANTTFAAQPNVLSCRIYEYVGEGTSPDNPINQLSLPIECNDLTIDKHELSATGQLLKTGNPLSAQYLESIRFANYDSYQLLVSFDDYTQSQIVLNPPKNSKRKSLIYPLECAKGSYNNINCTILDGEVNRDIISIWGI